MNSAESVAISAIMKARLIREFRSGMGSLILSGAEEAGEQDQRDAEEDRDIGPVEGWPMPVPPVEIQEIGHGTLTQPVKDIAGCPPGYQREANSLRGGSCTNTHPDEAERDCASQGSHQQRLVGHEAPQHPEACAGIEPEGQIEARQHRDGQARGQARQGGGFGCLICGECHKRHDQKDRKVSHAAPLFRPIQRGTWRIYRA